MKKFSGFTLIELLFCISILVIVSAIALPSMTSFIRRYRSETKGRELLQLIFLMRAKAYNERKTYILCPRGQGDSCGDDWSRGALLFADDDGDNEHDDAEKIERTFPALDAGASLSWNAFNNHGYLAFQPSGTTPSQSGNFSYCPSNGDAEYGWTIVLNAIGRPYFGKDKDGDGIAENGSGKNLVCAVDE